MSSSSNDYREEYIDFIVKSSVNGFEPDEISYRLQRDKSTVITPSTIENILEEDVVQERMDVMRRVQEKEADVTREELVLDLKETKDTLRERAEHLREKSLDEISNDTVKNILQTVKMLGEFIGELEKKDGAGGGSGNVININRLEQNFELTEMVQFLPASDKKSIVEQLEDDPEIEDYVIIRKNKEEEEEEEDGEEDEGNNVEDRDPVEVENEG